MSNDEFERLLSFFKALANESRLKIVGILANREASVGDLADLLELREPTVSHHLSILKELDLVRMQAFGNVHVYSLNEGALNEMKVDLLSPQKVATLVQDVDAQSWKAKVLRTYVIDERLTQIPANLRKRLVILQWLAEKFKHDERYSEQEVNALIVQHHPDTASLRRFLISWKFMARDHGVYWRIPEAEQLAGLARNPMAVEVLS